MSFSASRALAGTFAAAFVLTSLACGTGQMELPDPRRLIVHSGERLTPTKERMEEIDLWLREQMDSIELDPSFMIYGEAREGPVYPWESLETNTRGDTAWIGAQARSGAGSVYTLYAHLHLMAIQNRLDRWLPEAAGCDDFSVERAILARVADAWLYQRSLYDAPPYGLLDELIYSKENGYLDDFLLTARPDAFVEARRRWLEEDADRSGSYVDWFRRTFEREPPGLRGNPSPS